MIGWVLAATGVLVFESHGSLVCNTMGIGQYEDNLLFALVLQLGCICEYVGKIVKRVWHDLINKTKQAAKKKIK